MKHLKTFEKLSTTNIAQVLGDIIEKYYDKLRMDHLEIHDTGQIYLKIYEEFNQDNIDYFSEFFGILNKLKLKWTFKNESLTIDFTTFDEYEMDLLIQSDKFNL